MCGIAGQWTFNSSAQNGVQYVEKMIAAVNHRGPDGHGLYHDDQHNLALAHCRLSILDLEHGNQPMADRSGRYHITFNGEIYNSRSLALRLRDAGYEFAGHSDTECLLYAYIHWGEACLELLEGMFAFAIWDANKEQLFCARDRLGIKPFYYAWHEHRFVFCSELKGISEHPEIGFDVREGAINEFLFLGYVAGEQTMHRSVMKLPAGHSLTVANREVRKHRYWHLTMTDDYAGWSDAQLDTHLLELLNHSVEGCLQSDVPVGAFLSGGMDSSAVVALMSKHLSSPFPTQCVGFEQAKLDERAAARAVAEHYHTDHSDSLIELNVRDSLEDIIWHLDEPLADGSAIPTYYLSQQMAKRVKVALSGDGGDELFAGYDWYSEMQRLEYFDHNLPAWLRKGVSNLMGAPYFAEMRGATFLKNLGASFAQRHQNLLGLFDARQQHELLSGSGQVCAAHPLQALYEQGETIQDSMSRAQWIDLHSYLVEDILMKVDKMSMAHSLEVRVPLLHHDIVQFAFSLAPRQKASVDQRKRILKRSLKSILPASVMEKQKQGFSVSLQDWLLHDLSERVGDYLLSGARSHSGYFETAPVRKLYASLGNNALRIDAAPRIWALLCFEIWYDLNRNAATN